MAQFNLNEYETVEERIRRFYGDHADGRIITELIEHNVEKGLWVVKATVFEDYNREPKATGMAYELESFKGPQQSSALEVCETSAIGRALANMNYSGNKRASREEMQKVQRVTQAKAQTAQTQDWEKKIAALTSKDEARDLYKAAQKSAPQSVLEAITLKADKLK